MEDQLTVGPFDLRIFLREIHVGRFVKTEKKDKLVNIIMHPSTVEEAVELVLTALRVESYPILPERLHRSPFVICFDKNRKLSLQTEDLNSPAIEFEFDEADTFIKALQISKAKWLDCSGANNDRLGHIAIGDGTTEPLF